MNYKEMKDHEINAAVGEAMGWNAKFIHQDDSVTFRDDLGRLRGRKNYCKSWADAGPIIEKYRMTIMPASQGENWMAQAFEYALADVSTRPLRSAMIVFLMMQEKPNA
ncbi:phage protein NinX family protein [Pantoea anthophila]|uniref:phage protein NinX family protein n=1 Tax=Pantoea anthophila TaxID=470931 RepID=UPI002DBC67E5|nr:phage protein NinX family protein [Pantoea anthophila]MEB5707392.1 DUF2591 domain-containing protein [Pantoea anthophila]MEB6518263.1 DUF2591 domain-containing protein [Pantoea anthophila]